MTRRNSFILAGFSFILGSSITFFFVSLGETEFSDHAFSNLGHVINHENITNRYFLLILIFSSPENLSKRNTIRETWIKLNSNDLSVKHLFVIGTSGLSHEKELKLKDEFNKNDDVLNVDTISDSYKTLTSKLLKSFKLVEKLFNFKYLLKCDDDSFVQVAMILKYLKTKFHDEQSLYWGYFSGKAAVKKKGKWKEDKWFLCDRYLPYALGGGYVLSQNLVKYISANANFFSLYKSEDVSVGTWLSPLSINRVHDIRFDTEFSSRGCSNSYLITHKRTEKDMRHLYSEIVTNGRICSEEQQIRPAYDYNWNSLPSKCCIIKDSSLQ